jgi:hypothetical protein
MEKELDIILKEMDIDVVKEKISMLKKQVENNYNLKNFDIIEGEICMVYFKQLINYKYAEGIMQTKYYKIYKESGKSIFYSEFIDACEI